MLPKPHRLPPLTIKKVMRDGTRLKGEMITLILKRPGNQPQLTSSKFAFVVPMRLDKRATMRHRTKRLLSESVRRLIPKISLGAEVVILAQKSLADKSQTEVQQLLEDLLRQARLLNHETMKP